MAHSRTANILETLASTGSQSLSRLVTLIARVAVIVAKWTMTRRTRRQLMRLDRDMLRDIGIEPHQARAEARRPFWH